MPKHFVVSDGKLMLILEPAEEGGYNVSSPLDPQLLTQAETLEEAFANAYDAKKALTEARTKLAKAYPPPSSRPVRGENQGVSGAEAAEAELHATDEGNLDQARKETARSRRRRLIR